MSDNSPLVTVIVPVYKVELYLRRCLDSIVNQTYKNLEIILVDDGSPDNCGAICDEYASKDKRVKVIHKENGGLSSARNAGLDICSYEGYLAFVDSDDWLKLDAFERLVLSAQEHQCDMLVFNFIMSCGNKKVFINTTGNCKFSTDDVKHKLILDIWLNSVWDKFYKASIYKNIRFPEGQTFEDAYVMMEVLGQCKKICCIKDGLYFYNRDNVGSISKSINLRNFFDVYKGWMRKVEFKDFISREEYDFCLGKAQDFGKDVYYMNCNSPFLTKDETNFIKKTFNIKEHAYDRMKGKIIYYKYAIKKILSGNFWIWSYWKKKQISR